MPDNRRCLKCQEMLRKKAAWKRANAKPVQRCCCDSNRPIRSSSDDHNRDVPMCATENGESGNPALVGRKRPRIDDPVESIPPVEQMASLALDGTGDLPASKRRRVDEPTTRLELPICTKHRFWSREVAGQALDREIQTEYEQRSPLLHRTRQ